MSTDCTIIQTQVPDKPTTAKFMGSSSVPANIVFVITDVKAKIFVRTEGMAIFKNTDSICLVVGGVESWLNSPFSNSLASVSLVSVSSRAMFYVLKSFILVCLLSS